jgi:branched-chain amino acid aminotransferase
VAECTGENIFLVRKNILYTPPLNSILEGITRSTVIALAEDLHIPVKEEMISRDQLYTADEVFISGTAAELVGVRMVDFREVGEGKPGPITRVLLKTFLETVRGQGKHTEEWLDYIQQEHPAPGERMLIDL